MTRRPATAVVLSGTALALAAGAAGGQTFDFNPTFETIRGGGPSGNRVDLAFIGDGYAAGQKPAYDQHVDATLAHLFGSRLNDPFGRYANFFNVHQVNVVSQQSGADRPTEGVYRDTALGATYNVGGTERCLYFDTGLANLAVADALAGTGIDVDMRFGVVNDTKYGGCGGSWGVYAGGHPAGADIAIHEAGHSFGRLQDEYTYGGPAAYAGGELPGFVNVSTDPLAKWGQWYGYDDPFHDGAHGTPDMSPVGAYEGGYYSESGIFRPTFDSMMRSLGQPLNAVGREQIILKIYEEVDPLDAFLDNASPLTNPAQLWVEEVDPAVIDVDWYVDGTLVRDDAGGTLLLGDLGLLPGDYEITAVAADSVVDLAFTGLDFDWVRRDLDELQQSVTWSVSLFDEPFPPARRRLVERVPGSTGAAALTQIPEPASAALLAPLALLARRRRQGKSGAASAAS